MPPRRRGGGGTRIKPSAPPPKVTTNPPGYIPSEVARHRTRWVDTIAHAPDWSNVPFPPPASLADVAPTDLSQIFTPFAQGVYNAPRVLQTGMPHSEKGWFNMWFAGPRPKSQRAGNIPSQPPNTFAIGTEPTSWYGPGHEMAHMIERGTGINVKEFTEQVRQEIATNPEFRSTIENYMAGEGSRMDPEHSMRWLLSGDQPQPIQQTELFAMLPYDILRLQLDKMPESLRQYYSQIFSPDVYEAGFTPPGFVREGGMLKRSLGD